MLDELDIEWMRGGFVFCLMEPLKKWYLDIRPETDLKLATERTSDLVLVIEGTCDNMDHSQRSQP